MKTRIAELAVAALLIAGGAPQILRAQARASFEVASIRPHPAGDHSSAQPGFLPGGRFKVAGLPLQFVIAFAYNVPFQGQQFTGGPEWIRAQEGIYDIEAKADPDALRGLASEEVTMRAMLQALLADRFHLVMTREVKELPIYVLTVAKNGPKLQESKLSEDDCRDAANRCYKMLGGQGRGIHAKAYGMAMLAVDISNYTDRPLVDRTGLKGLYDIDSEGWIPMRQRVVLPNSQPTAEDLAYADPARPTLFQIFDKLGLKMEPSRAAVQTFVITSVEKPSEN